MTPCPPPSPDPDCLLVVPARLGSTRFPGKALVQVKGRPALLHVLERIRRCSQARLVVATDADEIARLCEPHAELFVSSEPFRCGSDRVAAAYQKLGRGEAFIVDVQGDELGLAPEALRQVLDARRRSLAKLLSPCIPMSIHENTEPTLGLSRAMHDKSMIQNTISDPNKVKVVFDRQHQALYFSRSPIPHDFTAPGTWHLHVGIFAYTAPALLDFARLPPSQLEQRESLEQLRAVEAGWRVDMVVLDAWRNRPWPSLNVPSDLAQAEAFL